MGGVPVCDDDGRALHPTMLNTEYTHSRRRATRTMTTVPPKKEYKNWEIIPKNMQSNLVDGRTRKGTPFSSASQLASVDIGLGFYYLGCISQGESQRKREDGQKAPRAKTNLIPGQAGTYPVVPHKY